MRRGIDRLFGTLTQLRLVESLFSIAIPGSLSVTAATNSSGLRDRLGLTALYERHQLSMPSSYCMRRKVYGGLIARTASTVE